VESVDSKGSAQVYANEQRVKFAWADGDKEQTQIKS